MAKIITPAVIKEVSFKCLLYQKYPMYESMLRAYNERYNPDEALMFADWMEDEGQNVICPYCTKKPSDACPYCRGTELVGPWMNKNALDIRLRVTFDKIQQDVDNDDLRMQYAGYMERREEKVPCTNCGCDYPGLSGLTNRYRIGENSLGGGMYDLEAVCNTCNGAKVVSNGALDRAVFIRTQIEISKINLVKSEDKNVKYTTGEARDRYTHFNDCNCDICKKTEFLDNCL